MYTGTLVHDLIAAVERAERRTQRKQYAEEMDLQQLFSLPVPEMNHEPVFAGAA